MISEQLDFTGKVAIVTGGATGIGYATALQLAGPCVLEAWKVARLDPDAMGCAIPLRRTGTPDEIANMIFFFVSDASSYITGQTVSVDGGPSLGGIPDN